MQQKPRSYVNSMPRERLERAIQAGTAILLGQSEESRLVRDYAYGGLIYRVTLDHMTGDGRLYVQDLRDVGVMTVTKEAVIQADYQGVMRLPPPPDDEGAAMIAHAEPASTREVDWGIW